MTEQDIKDAECEAEIERQEAEYEAGFREFNDKYAFTYTLPPLPCGCRTMCCTKCCNQKLEEDL